MSDETRYYQNLYDINDSIAANRALPSNTFLKNLVEELLDQRKVSDHSVYTGRLGVDILRLRYTGQASNSYMAYIICQAYARRALLGSITLDYFELIFKNWSKGLPNMSY